MIKKSEQLAKASKDLMLQESFYGLFLIMLNKQWNNKVVPTAGVARLGINYQLYINENFWDTLTPLQHIGLLKHELLHIAFFHITDYEHLTDKKIANIAMDIEINQYIEEKFLPPGPQLPSSYPELNLLSKQGTKYYYDALMQGAKNPGTCPNLDDMIAAMGNDPGTEGEGGEGKGRIKITLNGKGDLFAPDHNTWEDFENLDEATKKLVKSQTEHLIKEVVDQVTKSRGTVPSEMKEILDKMTDLAPAKFNWRGYIRRFVGGSIKTYTKSSRHKPNFRFLENPGLKHKEKRRILVAVDTSGSVSTEELKEFFNEIHHIGKTGTEIMLIQCDSAISSIGKFDKNKELIITGRGGTSFHPVTDYYDENYRKYNCLIYLTDGEAPAPDKCRGPVLWVISSKSPSMNDDLKGLQIQLN